MFLPTPPGQIARIFQSRILPGVLCSCCRSALASRGQQCPTSGGAPPATCAIPPVAARAVGGLEGAVLLKPWHHSDLPAVIPPLNVEWHVVIKSADVDMSVHRRHQQCQLTTCFSPPGFLMCELLCGYRCQRVCDLDFSC